MRQWRKKNPAGSRQLWLRWKTKDLNRWRDCMRRAQKKWHDANPEKRREIRSRWARKFRQVHRKEHYRMQKNWREKTRTRALAIFGSKCKRCGFSDPRALQFDHKKGGGNAERRESRKRSVIYFYRWSLLHPREAKKKFQLLCANCNWIKRAEQHEESIGNRNPKGRAVG